MINWNVRSSGSSLLAASDCIRLWNRSGLVWQIVDISYSVSSLAASSSKYTEENMRSIVSARQSRSSSSGAPSGVSIHRRMANMASLLSPV